MPGTPKSLETLYSWSPRNFVYCCAFIHFFAQNILFLMKVIFIQGDFKNIQGLHWKIQRLFKDIPQFFNFHGLMSFQGPCEPWFPSFEWHWKHILTGLDLWNVRTVRYAWDISMALFPVLRVFWRNNMASAVENTSWKPLETPFPRL